ncbi:adenosylcobinamide-GDP ribazoletransferase [Haloarchaeobius sp. DFWS5]|uniref:adenosylcobinamide-GDP ribazoletransferase n=1 Tax=Haloarchaeobius sp. DFWS5 TaxID=3446114 RepID=UPI003EB7C223
MTRAVRGALGFLTRLPVGHDESAWDAYTDTPAAMVLVGYLVGGLVAVPVVAGIELGLPTPVTAFAALVSVYALTGIAHLDGVADCGDAAVVHGDRADRREVLKDTTTGVGALAAVGLVLAGLATGFLAVTALPLLAAVAIVVASEVGSKTAMTWLVGRGDAPHEGFGQALTSQSGAGTAALGLVLAVPVGFIGLGAGTPAPVGSLVAALAVAVVAHRWAATHLGGVNGDVFGAANELARVAGLHAGVVLWTLW